MHSRSNAKCAWPLRKDDTLQPMLSAQNSATVAVTFGQVRVSLVNTSMSQELSTFNGVLHAFEPMEKHIYYESQPGSWLLLFANEVRIGGLGGG